MPDREHESPEGGDQPSPADESSESYGRPDSAGSDTTPMPDAGGYGGGDAPAADTAPPEPPSQQPAFVTALVKDPNQPPDVLLLTGYLGASSEKEHTRLYLDPSLSD